MATLVLPTTFGRSLAVEFHGNTLRASDWLSAGSRRRSSGDLPPVAEEVRDQVRRYGKRELEYFDLPLDFEGSEFEQKIWHAVYRLPFGFFVSYGDVARAIGHPGAHRGVARAMGSLAYALFVPAHRVIGADGRIKGAADDSMRVRLFEFEKAGL